MKHVKVIEDTNLLELEKRINKYLAIVIEDLTGTTNGDQVEDIKFTATDCGYYALLIF